MRDSSNQEAGALVGVPEDVDDDDALASLLAFFCFGGAVEVEVSMVSGASPRSSVSGSGRYSSASLL